MELIIVLVVLLFLAFPIWTIVKILGQGTEISSLRSRLSALENLRSRLSQLETEIATLRDRMRQLSPERAAETAATSATDIPETPPAPALPTSAPPSPASPGRKVDALPATAEKIPDRTEAIAEPQGATASVVPPPLPAAALASNAVGGVASADTLPTVPPLPPVVAAPPASPSPPAPRWIDTIDWEQFMGAKLFAWLGGLALFLGLAFFVKYSLDHNLVSREMRVAIGFLTGAGLLVGGLRMGARYAVLAQTLMATGVVSLYAVTFVCGEHGYNLLGPTALFALICLITATGFILAVRLNAQVIAILGILGGFLSPVLLSTGQDNPGGLFGYVALLDLGLTAVALSRSWYYLVPLGATGTVLTLVGWAGKFLVPEKTGIAMGVCLGFSALFAAVLAVARRRGHDSRELSVSAMALPAVGFGFALYFLGWPAVAGRIGFFFGFVFLVSLVTFALAWLEGAGYLVAAAAGFTAAIIARWTGSVFTVALAPTAITVWLVFSAVYFVVYLVAQHFERASKAVLGAAIGLPAGALLFTLFLLDQPELGVRPGLLFSFIIGADLLLLALSWLDERAARVHLASGLGVFLLLAMWTGRYLTDALLPWALGIALVFAALHTAFPLVLERRRPSSGPTFWSQLFPPLALLLMLFPLVRLDTVPLLLWPAILLVDLLAIALAAITTSVVGVGIVLVLSLAATGGCILHQPATALLEPSLLVVIGGFALLFFAAGSWLLRKLGARISLPAAGNPFVAFLGDPRAPLPALASLLPFLLLILACARLPVPDPSPVFGLALLLVGLTLGLAVILGAEWLPACALAGVAALEFTWHARHFAPAESVGPLAWYLGFYTVFTSYPFLFRRKFSTMTGPWAVAALGGVAHFWMIYQGLRPIWPAGAPGVVPALFALAPLASLFSILRRRAENDTVRLNQLAWFGGVALFFITLIFPIQFERQWLTVAWALEGAALFWLFLRVPHPGLRLVGAGLLVTAFVRLAFNPAVLEYHVRGVTGIWNWYLYAYGLATLALFAGARWHAQSPVKNPAGKKSAPWLALLPPTLFNALGVVLAFLLLNLEIADYFTPPGARVLTFQFSGLFARDMSYTIGWAFFALVLLCAGIWRKSVAARYAALALLSVTLLKLFFRDLAHLDALYRVGALVGVAVIAFLASFVYQRFAPGHDSPPPPSSS